MTEITNYPPDLKAKFDTLSLRRANDKLLLAAYQGNERQLREAMAEGANIDAVDPKTGLAALHLTIGTHNLPLTRIVVEEYHASFFADGFGRWPTNIAAVCGVNIEMGDYVVEAECRAEGISLDDEPDDPPENWVRDTDPPQP